MAYTISDKQELLFVLNRLKRLPDTLENTKLHNNQGAVYTSYQYKAEIKIQALPRVCPEK